MRANKPFKQRPHFKQKRMRYFLEKMIPLYKIAAESVDKDLKVTENIVLSYFNPL